MTQLRQGCSLKYQFASDNTSGVCPEAWSAMVTANQGYEPSYGADSYTETASRAFRDFFETDCEIFFVFNGTAANSLALASLCQSYHSVIAHEMAHIETDECGAPEFFSNGTKLLLASGADGKLAVDSVSNLITKRKDIHYPRPRVLSLSQATELGTIYSPEEIRSLCGIARFHGLKTHMDGARFLHAVTSLDIPPRKLTWELGIDVLCFGGTKAGIGFSEVIVFFDKSLARDFEYRCKQAGQLASKMRFLSAPWISFLKDKTYLKYSAKALAQARQLAEAATRIPGVSLLYPVQANSVFLKLPEHIDKFLQNRGWKYYHFIGGGARFMCSWQTQDQDIAELVGDLRTSVQE